MRQFWKTVKKFGQTYIKLNSLFGKLFLSFLAVMIPIYFTGLLVYNWGIAAIKDEVRNSAQIRVAYLQDTLESEVRRIRELQLDSINDKNLNKLINEFDTVPDYERYFMIDNVQQRMRIMKNSSAYIGDVIVYLPEINRIISANNGFDSFRPENFQQIIHTLKTDTPLLINNDHISMNLVYPAVNLVNNLAPLFVIEVQLSTDSLSNILTLFNEPKGGSSVLFDSSGNQLAKGRNNNHDISSITSLAQMDIPLGQSGSKTVELYGKTHLAVYSSSKYLNFTIFELIPLDQLFQAPKRYKIIFWIFSTISLLIIITYSISTFRFVHRPMKRIVKAFGMLKNGDFSVRITEKRRDEFDYLYEGFNRMMERLNDLIDTVYRQELYAKNAELKQLQAQINPHFLYNSFFILHRTIKSREFDEALQLSKYLGTYFQYITRSTSYDEMKLFQELEHVKNYTAIQIFRFHERLSVEFDSLDEKYREITVPRLILQPLIENAVEHGMKTTLEGGIIQVRFAESDSNLLIFIEDNGSNLNDNELEELQIKLLSKENKFPLTGILNVHRRIQLKFGPKSGISVSRSKLQGLKVTISLALVEEVNDVSNSDC